MLFSRRTVLSSCLLAAALTLGACGGETSPIFLAPTPEMSMSDVGQQQRVVVSVADVRGTAALGTRTPLVGEAEDIDSLQDVEDVLRTQIERGLRAKGFVPVQQLEGATRRLDVKLEHFAYDTESSVVSSKVSVNTAMSVAAHVDGRTFNHSYTSKSEETVALGPSEATRERAVNAALTALLDKFMQDDALFEVLAGE